MSTRQPTSAGRAVSRLVAVQDEKTVVVEVSYRWNLLYGKVIRVGKNARRTTRTMYV
jgi:hypothetical protein